MGLGRYVVDAVLIEKRSPTEIAKAHGISRSWLYALIARVRGGGYEAVNLLVAGAQVRIVTEEGESSSALSPSTQPVTTSPSTDAGLSTMSCDRSPGSL